MSRSSVLSKIREIALWPFSKCNKEMPSLVFDLDNTLVYSTELPTKQYTFETFVRNKKYYVHVRPGAFEVLKKLSEFYQIYFFTASSKEYAEFIIGKIAPFVKKEQCFYKESCIFKFGYAIKDLKLLNQPLNKVILIDDIIGSGAMQPINTIGVEPWEGQGTDRVLQKELFPLLMQCSEETDIPNAVRTKAEKSSLKHLSFFVSSKKN